jgi:hypothetical protein
MKELVKFIHNCPGHRHLSTLDFERLQGAKPAFMR